MTATPKPYYRRAQVAAALGVRPDTVDEAYDRLPHTRTLGGQRRFDTAGVDAEAARRARRKAAATAANATNPTRKDQQ